MIHIPVWIPESFSSRMNGTSGGKSAENFYRSDIDGLRAVAVLAVVFYHLSPSLLPGGYLGVDIFFVISGYLITSIIWSEAGDQKFSIARFYERRIRRVMPALMFLLFVATFTAVVLLLPTDLMGYSKSLLAALAFVPNIYFWRDTDYFSRAAEDKPLLHLWSLGVEEQFYIFFPLILAFLARRWPKGALWVVILLAVASLFLNGLALHMGGASPAFFLLPTRAWELGAGAMLALLPSKLGPCGFTADLMALVGAWLVGAGILCPAQLHYAIPIALPLVVGTALLVLAGRKCSPMVNTLLGLRPLVVFGLFSYSLYLWHWPIIVFVRYYAVRGLSSVEMAVAFATMVICAVGSWHFVEKPFRGRKIPIRTTYGVALVCVLVVAAAASTFLWKQGLPQRLNGNAAIINQAIGTNYRCPVGDYLFLGASRACTMNLPSRNVQDADVVLLGNSHAQMYAPVWTDILVARNQTGLLVPSNGCLPTVKANVSADCIAIAERNLHSVTNISRVSTVILGLTWWHDVNALVDAAGKPLDNSHNRALIESVDDLIEQLQRAGKQVVLIGPIAEPGWDIATNLGRQLAFGRPVVEPLFSSIADFSARFEAAIAHFSSRSDIGFAQPYLVQCAKGRCDYLLDGHSLFADSNHIAAAELYRFRAQFEVVMPPPGR